jgi:L,D-transpeptidase catalytic domain
LVVEVIRILWSWGHSMALAQHRRKPLRSAAVALAALAAVMAFWDPVTAVGRQNEPSVESIETRTAGEAILAIVSLRGQRITVYDANGWILRAPVSSGRKGRETPAGVFSVIQKNAEHYSNLYDDAYMPHMQRLTWSGIALHGGALPGYPASHGCVRLPFDFAARLFDTSTMGMRVIVAPGDVAPVEIAHPLLSQLKPADDVAAARAAEAEEATRRANEARLAAVMAYRQAGRAMMPVRVAENLKRRAEAELAAADATLGSAHSSADEKENAEDAKRKALGQIADLEAQWSAAKAALQPKLNAIAPAREAAVSAEAKRLAAVEAARELAPVSVFISRASQRLYVRRSFQPVLESPVTILDSDSRIGTHVYTAMARSNGAGELRWSAVSVESGRPDGVLSESPGQRRAGRDGRVQQMSTAADSAKEALDRILIPQDVLNRIAEMMSARSSLIVSDELLSSETGKDTDFVVVLSGEPQGSLKLRRRSPGSEAHHERAHDRAPYGRPYSTW